MFPAAALLTCVAFCASGLGRLLLGRVSIAQPFRAVAAQYLVGFLAYSALFGLAAQVRMPFVAVSVLFLLLGVFSLYGVLGSAASERRHAVVRLLLAGVVGASLFACGWVKGNRGAVDPVHYAYSAAVMFRDAWVRARAAHLPAYGSLTGIHEATALIRAPAVAALWPPAALGWGVDIDMVTGTSAWFLATAAVLLADTLSGFAPLPVRLVLAAGGVGVFNATSALIGGQINQSAALLAALAGLWVCRFGGARRERLVTLALVGNVLAAAYPEFLLVLPLYFGCGVALRRVSLRGAACEAAVLALGALLVQASTRLASARFFVRQSAAAPGWLPLPAAPGNVLDLWTVILLEHSPWQWLLPALIVAGLYVWTRAPQEFAFAPARAAVRPVAVGLPLMAGLWSWAALRAANANYAAFKLGGWLGPGVFVLAWILLRHAGPAARRVLATALLTVAVARMADLGAELPRMTSLLRSTVWHPRLWIREDGGPNGTGCVVRAASGRADVLMRAIAESGAPGRGCAMAVSDAAALAAAYIGRPPRTWRPGETKAYVVGIWNASSEPWVVDGPAAVHLGVRFLAPGAEPGDAIRYGLPGPIPPGGTVHVRVEIPAPATPGRYILEQRVVEGRAAWSNEALLTPVSVK